MSSKFLLTQPTELRNKVYKYAFADGNVENLDLLLACRQIYQEAVLIAFASTEFVVPMPINPDGLDSRVARLSDQQKAAIMHISKKVHRLSGGGLSLSQLGVRPQRYTFQVDNADFPTNWTEGRDNFLRRFHNPGNARDFKHNENLREVRVMLPYKARRDLQLVLDYARRGVVMMLILAIMGDVFWLYCMEGKLVLASMNYGSL